MRILVDIGHPAQVHFFKHILWALEKKGHIIKIALRNSDVTRDLLNIYGFDYECVMGRHGQGLLGKALAMVYIDYKFWKIAKKYNPDIVIGETGYMSHVGKIIQKPSILICNNEHALLENTIFLPFADLVVVSTSFQQPLKYRNLIQYNGYFFQPYLDPRYFTPDPTVLTELGIGEGDPFSILRFSAWDAAHDVGKTGLSYEGKLRIIHKLERKYKVFILSEVPLDDRLKKYALNVAPEKFHSLLYYASLYIGEGGSTAAEAAILGVPSIFVSPLKLGYMEELKNRYGLMYTTGSENELMATIDKIKSNITIKEQWQEKRNLMLSEKIDVVQFMMKLIEQSQKKNLLSGFVR